MPPAPAPMIGTAGWQIPRASAHAFPAGGSVLERYAQVFGAAEINTTFYRSHRPATYARWVASVPAGFRFAAKLPREITHERRLVDAQARLEAFLAEIQALGDRLGPLLVQLPPSLAYDEAAALPFFAALRRGFAGAVACEPRHASWFADAVGELLAQYQVARVAADPAPVPRAAVPGAAVPGAAVPGAAVPGAAVPGAAVPGGWAGLVYRRLHGSPIVYRSAYDAAFLDALAGDVGRDKQRGAQCWCIFDNTTLGAAAADAGYLRGRLR